MKAVRAGREGHATRSWAQQVPRLGETEERPSPGLREKHFTVSTKNTTWVKLSALVGVPLLWRKLRRLLPLDQEQPSTGGLGELLYLGRLGWLGCTIPQAGAFLLHEGSDILSHLRREERPAWHGGSSVIKASNHLF